MGNLPFIGAFAARKAADAKEVAADAEEGAAEAGMGDSHAQRTRNEDQQLEGESGGGCHCQVNEASAVLARDNAEIETLAREQHQEEPLVDAAPTSTSSDSPNRPDIDGHPDNVSSNVDAAMTARSDLGNIPSLYNADVSSNNIHGSPLDFVASLKRDDDECQLEEASSAPQQYPDSVYSIKMEQGYNHGSTDHSSFVMQEDPLGTSFAAEPIDVASSTFKQEHGDHLASGVKQEQPDAVVSLEVEQQSDAVYLLKEEPRRGDDDFDSRHVKIPSSRPKKRHKKNESPPPMSVAGQLKDPPNNACNVASQDLPSIGTTTKPRAHESVNDTATAPTFDSGNVEDPFLDMNAHYYVSHYEDNEPIYARHSEQPQHANVAQLSQLEFETSHGETKNGVAAATTASCRNFDDPLVLMNTYYYISHYEDGQPIYARHSKEHANATQSQWEFETIYEDDQSFVDCTSDSEEQAKLPQGRGDGAASFVTESEARGATDSDDNDAKMPAIKEVAQPHLPLERAATTTSAALNTGFDEPLLHSRVATAETETPNSRTTTTPEAQCSDERIRNGPNGSLVGARPSRTTASPAPDGTNREGTCVRKKSAATKRNHREVSSTIMKTFRVPARVLLAHIVADMNPYSLALEAVEPCPSTPVRIMVQEWRTWKVHFDASRSQAAEAVTCPSMASIVQAHEDAWRNPMFRTYSFHGITQWWTTFSAYYTLYQRPNRIGDFDSPGKALLARHITRALLEHHHIANEGCNRWIVKVCSNGIVLACSGRFSSREQAIRAYRVAKEKLKAIHFPLDVVSLQAFLDRVFADVAGPGYWVLLER